MQRAARSVKLCGRVWLRAWRPPREAIGSAVFGGLVAISLAQWDQFAEHNLLRPDVDRVWAAPHPLVLVIGTVALRAQLDRHLPAALATPAQLRRRDDAVAGLQRSGLFQRQPAERER